ncbi:MAG: hypothetical protein ABSH22_00635 [Tepidisphaeraceae bacterium]
MQLILSRWPLIAAISLLLVVSGCGNAFVSPAPVGPGAATEANLTPWLPTATAAQRMGWLMEINVPSEQGSYDTWGLAATEVALSVEVDVRGCAGTAEDFRGKEVMIEGKMIPRGDRHLPLLVADRIVAVDEHGNPLPDSGRHIAHAPDLDPVSEQADPLIEFQGIPNKPSGQNVTAAAN